MGRMHEGGGVRATVARRSNKLAESPLRLPSIRTIVRLLSFFFLSFFKLLIDFLRIPPSVTHECNAHTHTCFRPSAVSQLDPPVPRPPPEVNEDRR